MPSDDSRRGVIHHLQRAMQHIDYGRLRWGLITPTNIDGLIDFGNRLFVILEFKGVGAPFHRGQKLALERLCRMVFRGGARCVVLIAEHTVSDPSEAISASECQVVELLDSPRWRKPKRPVTVGEAIDCYRSAASIREAA